jgi:antitoxin VapB
MGFNIKNPEAHRLAKQLSDLTGESLTAAVTEAIRERLERLQGAGSGGNLADRLLAIGRRTAAHLKDPVQSADHGELLYDKQGLPR